MSTRNALLALALAVASLGAAAARAETPGLGQPIAEADVAAWDIAAMPSGAGLPPGSGTAAQGATVFVEKCCSPAMAKAARAARWRATRCSGARRSPARSRRPRPSATSGATPPRCSISPAAPCRSIQPRRLTDRRALRPTAYILFLNKIIGENDVMDAKTLPQVKMPNRDNFIIRFPDRI